MKTNLIYREEDGWYIGHLQEYPDFESQGETLQELQENLVDIYSDIQEGLVPNATPSKVLELVI
jgi:predicted RNase H-like HicB family nuclease